jgi:hypothetical protein
MNVKQSTWTLAIMLLGAPLAGATSDLVDSSSVLGIDLESGAKAVVRSSDSLALQKKLNGYDWTVVLCTTNGRISWITWSFDGRREDSQRAGEMLAEISADFAQAGYTVVSRSVAVGENDIIGFVEGKNADSVTIVLKSGNEKADRVMIATLTVGIGGSRRKPEITVQLVPWKIGILIGTVAQ